MRIKQDPISGLWCREDGKILMPPTCGGQANRRTYEWVSGYAHDEDGYLTVYRHRAHRVHRIIARAFIPNPSNLPTVDHIDRNPKNNAVGNLRWASYKMQAENHGNVLNRVDYGVRCCEDKKAYYKAYNAAYDAAQKAKGLVKRKCPDGKQHWVAKESIIKKKQRSSDEKQ